MNLKDEQTKEELNDLIELQLQEFKDNLIAFGEDNDLSDFEEDVDEEINTISNGLEDKLFSPEEIHVCRTGSDLAWQMNEYWTNEKEFIKFYNENNNKYVIEDEYGVVSTLEEFLKKIHWKGQRTKYLRDDFS